MLMVCTREVFRSFRKALMNVYAFSRADWSEQSHSVHRYQHESERMDTSAKATSPASDQFQWWISTTPETSSVLVWFLPPWPGTHSCQTYEQTIDVSREQVVSREIDVFSSCTNHGLSTNHFLVLLEMSSKRDRVDLKDRIVFSRFE